MGLPGYGLNEIASDDGLRFLFESRSFEKTILKIIDYSVVEIKHDVIKTEEIYNLGFTDLSEDYELLDDETISNNGDNYQVFYTILNSIPVFFEHFPNSAIVISGSDSKNDFPDKCFLVCSKNCLSKRYCKNKDRRVRVYSGYVNKNYVDLNKEYSFFGGVEDTIEPYERYKKYKSVFVIKNK